MTIDPESFHDNIRKQLAEKSAHAGQEGVPADVVELPVSEDAPTIYDAGLKIPESVSEGFAEHGHTPEEEQLIDTLRERPVLSSQHETARKKWPFVVGGVSIVAIAAGAVFGLGLKGEASADNQPRGKTTPTTGATTPSVTVTPSPTESSLFPESTSSATVGDTATTPSGPEVGAEAYYEVPLDKYPTVDKAVEQLGSELDTFVTNGEGALKDNDVAAYKIIEKDPHGDDAILDAVFGPASDRAEQTKRVVANIRDMRYEVARTTFVASQNNHLFTFNSGFEMAENDTRKGQLNRDMAVSIDWIQSNNHSEAFPGGAEWAQSTPERLILTVTKNADGKAVWRLLNIEQR